MLVIVWVEVTAGDRAQNMAMTGLPFGEMVVNQKADAGEEQRCGQHDFDELCADESHDSNILADSGLYYHPCRMAP